MIIICGKLIAGPYESSEADFLICICNQINANPDLINCFLSHSFPLISALLALLQSPDQEISTKCGDALIRLLSVVNQRAEQIITFETPFCAKIMDQMVTLYHSIPPSLRPEQMETAISFCFKAESLENGSTFEAFSAAVRRFLCFLRWFVFFDMIVNHIPTKDGILLKALLNQFKIDFLESCICPDLLGIGYKEKSDAEEHIILTTDLLSNCLQNTISLQLATTVSEYLLIDTKNDLLINNQMYSDARNQLKNILLDRCSLIQTKTSESIHNSVSDAVIDNKRIQLCMSTMQLLEEILNKPSVLILNELVINYLSDRTYFDESVLLSSDANLDSNEFYEFKSGLPSISSLETQEVSDGFVQNFNYVSTSHIQRILQYFISLVPDELKSCQTSDDMGYETYVREAQKHFQEITLICNEWKQWSAENNLSDDSHQELSEANNSIKLNGDSEHIPEHKPKPKEFFEGPFLTMIFNNLEYMVQLPYEVNLQVLIYKIDLQINI